MKILSAGKENYQEIIDVWEMSVRAAHDFLSEKDIQFFKPLILNEFLSEVELWCVKCDSGKILGFLGVADGNIEMLFILPAHQGKGIGKQLLNYAVNERGATKVDVNEQNPEAIGFYQHFGFEVVRKSPVDEMGKPFPLLHMKINASNKAMHTTGT